MTSGNTDTSLAVQEDESALPENELLSVPQVAQLLGLTISAIYASCKRKTLPHIHLGDRVLIPREAYKVWMAERIEEALAAVKQKGGS